MTDLSLLPPDTGVMLCGHGSRNQLAVGEFAALAEGLQGQAAWRSASNTAISNSPIR